MFDCKLKMSKCCRRKNKQRHPTSRKCMVDKEHDKERCCYTIVLGIQSAGLKKFRM